MRSGVDCREACRQMHEWYTRLFGETLARMKSIDEGGSSLLDNTLLVYTSYMADGGHSREDYPILLAGRGSNEATDRSPRDHTTYDTNYDTAPSWDETVETTDESVTEPNQR